MNSRRRLRRPEPAESERGAALLLAIVVLIVIGMISATLLASITSAANGRVILDAARNREYAADAGIETAIANVRQITTPPGVGLASCGGPYLSSLDGVNIRTTCTNTPTPTTATFLERDVIFTACVDTGAACTNATTIIRAQVNFATTTANTLTIAHTYIQSWSVNQ
jgi:type II secretory pathway pseudopilin PulG